MYPKTALKILGIITVCIAIFFIFLFIKQKSNLKSLKTNNQESVDVNIESIVDVNIESIIKRKNKGEKIEEENQKQLEEIIKEKIEEEYQKLQEKAEKGNKEEYTQKEVNFILNPEKTIKKELGIEIEDQTNPYTQEEIDNILYPQNNN